MKSNFYLWASFLVLLLSSCNSDLENEKLADLSKKVNAVENLFIAVDDLDVASLAVPLEKLYLDMFEQIEQKIRSEQADYFEILFRTTLDKDNKVLYIDEINYFTKEQAELAQVIYDELQIDNPNIPISTRDVNAVCQGGKHDGTSGTFKENLSGVKKLVQFTQECLKGGGCVKVCSAENYVVIDEKY